MSKPQCRVAEDYQIEYTEVACRSQDRLGCRGDSEPICEVHRERLSVATDQQPRPSRTRISVEHGSEDGVGDGGWQPPAPKPSGRQVRESSGSRQHQLPCRQFLELGTAQCRGVHPTRDAFPLPASEPPCTGECGVFWTVTLEASGRGLESCVSPHICGPPAVPAHCCGKPVTCYRKLVTHHVKLGATRVGSDRLRHVGDSGRRGGC